MSSISTSSGITERFKFDSTIVIMFPTWLHWSQLVVVLMRSLIPMVTTEQNRTEQNRTEQNRTEQNRTKQNRTEQVSASV
jgi:hypothetical protein